MKTSSKISKKISAKAFDRLFEEGDVTPYLDLTAASVHRPIKRINLDIPVNILNQIDHEANRIGVARTALIKVWLAEKIELSSHA
jgi:hypothetical protein